MPWCPNCRVEYREGFKVCNDCEAELVDELEPEKDESEIDEAVLNDKLVLLTSVQTGMEFEMIKSLLRPYDIAVTKISRRLSSSIIGEANAGIELYVLSSQLEQARDIIENCPREISEEELESQALQYEPEPDEIDEAVEDEEYDEEPEEDSEMENVQEAVQNSFVLYDKDGVKATYIDFRWMIVIAFLAIAAIYIIVHFFGNGF